MFVDSDYFRRAEMFCVCISNNMVSKSDRANGSIPIYSYIDAMYHFETENNEVLLIKGTYLLINLLESTF